MIPTGFNLLPVYVMDENGEYHELGHIEDLKEIEDFYKPDDFIERLSEMLNVPNNHRKYRGKKVMRWRKILSMT